MVRMDAYDIGVRGSGAVALAAALALGRQGLRVALRATPAPLSADVRAYALNAASVSLLHTLKVWDALPADACTPVHDMHVEGDAHGAVLDFSAWSHGVPELAWIVDAAELEQALRAAARFSPHVQSVDEDVQATLQVLAEGKDSAARDRLGVRLKRQSYGQRGVATRLVSDQPHAHLARQWFRSPDILALLPLDRPLPGRSYGLVWSVPDERADALMALGDEAFAVELLAATGSAAGSLRVVGPRAQWPLAVGRAEAVHGRGWVLLGDAAHLVHPLAGQGLNLGLADVSTLVAVLGARESWRTLDDPRLLGRYARARLGPTLAMAGLTDALLHLFASPQPAVRLLRNRGLSLVNQAGPLKRLLTRRALGA